MRTRSRAALLAAAVALAGLSTSACGYIGMLKAQMAFKDANAAYQTQDYKKAIEKYKEALEHKPDLSMAYFYLGNSYDNLYKPARKGEAANDANLQEAVSYYRKATETITDNPKLRKLSYEYLLAAYGSEKLNDPSQAEPIVKKMIEMEPDEPNNYYALAKIYEDAGNYEEAEKMLLAARDKRPKDATTYMQLAGFYNRQGRFDKTIEALEARAAAEPNNPEAYYTIATYLWDKTLPRLPPEGAREARLPRQRRRGDQQGHRHQGRLPRGHRLQGPPAPAAGQHGEGPHQAAGAAEGSRRAPRSRQGPAEVQAGGGWSVVTSYE